MRDAIMLSCAVATVIATLFIQSYVREISREVHDIRTYIAAKP